MASGDTVWIRGQFESIERPTKLFYTWAVEPAEPTSMAWRRRSTAADAPVTVVFVENDGFTALLEERSRATDDRARAKVDARIRERYERDAAVLIIDMSGFSRITQEEGIIHFLALIHRMHGLVLPVIDAAEGGHLVKTEADNVYAMFDTTQAAVDTAIGLQETCERAFEGAAENDTVALSIGIAWGRLLDLDGSEFYGDPVNLASKLGEDLASRGEIFVTRDAAASVRLPAGWVAIEKYDRISNVDIEFVALERA